MANYLKLPRVGIITRVPADAQYDAGRISLKVVTRDKDKDYFVGSYLYDDPTIAEAKARKKFKCKVIENHVDTNTA